MLKNRTILGILCILLAVGVSFGAAPLVNKVTAEKMNIVRMVKDVPQGSQITADDIETVNVGGYHLPDAVIKNTNEVIGKYATCDLKADDYLFPSKLSDEADNADDVFRTLNGKEQAMSVTIDSFASGLSGKLKNGDIVSILVIGKDSSATATIPPELKYVKVITTTTSSGSDTDVQKTLKDGESAELPSTVTLLVNEEQAKVLAQHETNNTMHIILVYRGDVETANKFLAVQKEVFTDE
jgi:pilus assembly protein CpaB